MTRSDSSPQIPYRITHDWETNESITLTIVEAVEQLRGEGAPSRLYDHVNPDALEAILCPSIGGATRPGVSVSFEYDGFTISAAGDGEVVIDATSE